LKSLRELPLFQELVTKAASKHPCQRKCGRFQKRECPAPQEQPPANPFGQVFENVEPLIQQFVASLPDQDQILAQVPFLQQMFTQILAAAAAPKPAEPAEPAKVPEPVQIPEPVKEPVQEPEVFLFKVPDVVPEPAKVPEPVQIPEPVKEPEVVSQAIPAHLPQSVKNNLAILNEMGFKDTKQNLKVLLLARGDVSVAIAKLLSGN